MTREATSWLHGNGKEERVWKGFAGRRSCDRCGVLTEPFVENKNRSTLNYYLFHNERRTRPSYQSHSLRIRPTQCPSKQPLHTDLFLHLSSALTSFLFLDNISDSLPDSLSLRRCRRNPRIGVLSWISLLPSRYNGRERADMGGAC